MLEFQLPYYKHHMTLSIEDKERLAGALISNAETYIPKGKPVDLVKKALKKPIGSKSLAKLAKKKKHIVVITSDHTRPVPSHVTMPIILKEIRKHNKDVRITILIATGMHRPTTKEEMIEKFGKEVVENEEFVVHDAYKDEDMVFKGILPSGGEVWLNKLVNEADLLISEGFIEPHFFAGFSGGRKSVLPGIASKKTVLWNHNAKFIAHPAARAGSLLDNPIHKDMLFAANVANLAFILNVVINSEKEIISAYAGDPSKAHNEGCKFVAELAKVKPVPADIVVTTNGGYPLDQNIYQTVKGMTAAEACVKTGGVIVMVSSCIDGHGGDFFYRTLADAPSPKAALEKIEGVEPSKTVFDQWESQILARILVKSTVILVSDLCDPKIITDMHMLHAKNVNEAMAKAEKIAGKDSRITVIPDGVAVIVKD